MIPRGKPPVAIGSVVLALLVALAASGCSIAATTAPAPPEPTAPTTPPAADLGGPWVGPVPGVVGGYVYGDSGSAAPWIPASALSAVSLRPAAPLEIALEPAIIAGWSLRTAAAADTQGEEPHPLAEGEAPAADGSIRFAGPPAGRWVLEARITYANGLGDGAYYWLLNVAEP